MSQVLSSKIEVIISDNCSSDHTKDIMKKYENYSFITYLEATENCGADLNFLKLINISTGKFAWIFGDDEVLFDNGLEKIINILEQNGDVGLVHITQHGHFKLDMFNSKEPHAEPVIEKFEDSNLFLEKVSVNLSFITSNIFNQSLVDSKAVDQMLFSKSFLNQQTFYLQAALKAKKNIFITGYIFSQLINNTGGYGLFEIFATNQQEIFRYFMQFGLENKTIHKINKDMLRKFFPPFILMEGQKSEANNIERFKFEKSFQILFNNFKGYLSFWIFCMPLFVLPSGLRLRGFNLVRKVKLLVKNKQINGINSHKC